MRPVLFSCLQHDLRSASFFAWLSALAAFLYFRSRRRSVGLSLDDFWNLMLVLPIGLFLGGALAHAALYGQGVTENIQRILRDRAVSGGSFFGALFGSAAAAVILCRLRGLDRAAVLDVLGAAAALGLVPMRVGCLLNGCCHGLPTRLPWGIVFRDDRGGVSPGLLGTPLHPSQAYEAGGALVLFLLVHFVSLRRARRPAMRPGAAFAIFVGLYGLLRFGLDFVRGSDTGRVSIWGLSTAQLIALPCIAAAAVWHFLPTLDKARGRTYTNMSPNHGG